MMTRSGMKTEEPLEELPGKTLKSPGPPLEKGGGLKLPLSQRGSSNSPFHKGVYGGIGANFRLSLLAEATPSPCPLPPGERVSQSPSLDGRGKGEGDNRLILLGQVP